MIDLGSADGAFTGLRLRAYEFRDGALGKGRLRANKGMVEIVEVLGPHESRVRTLFQEEPIQRGDLLSNPLFRAGEPVHVWLHETLDRTHLAPALRRMRVVVDGEIDGNTDFIVVPDVPLPPDADDEELLQAGRDLDADQRLRKQARMFAVAMISVTDMRLFLDL